MLDFTPTVGLGCRSGGYLIFFSLAFGNFAIELLIWWLIPATTWSTSWSKHLAPVAAFSSAASTIERRLSRTNSDRWKLITNIRILVHRTSDWWTDATFRDRLEFSFLRPCEVVNSIWLFYIVMAQTFGFDQNCNCFCSLWSSIGVRSSLNMWNPILIGWIGVYGFRNL